MPLLKSGIAKKNNGMKPITILLIFCLSSYNLFAQKDSSFRNIELPAASIKHGNSLAETTIENSEIILTKKNIQKLNTAADVPFILNQTPATVVGSDAGTGVGYTNIRIRGADVSRINVNMNGIPINDAEGQGVFFVNFPDILGSANSLSIQRGIGSSKSGYGNFGGAISINNLDVDYEKPHVSFMTDYASFNTLKNSLKASTGLINDKFITTVRLSRIVSDGYVNRSAATLNSGQITAQYKITPDATLTCNYLGGKEKTQQSWNGVAQILDATADTLIQSIDTIRQKNELGQKADGTFYNNQTDNYQQDYYQLFFDNKKKNIGNTNGIIRYGGALYFTKGKGYYEEYKLGENYSDYGLANFVQGNDTATSTDLIRQLWLDNNFYGVRAYVNYLNNKTQLGLYANTSRYEGLHFGEVIWADRGIANDYRWYDLDATKTDNNIYAMGSQMLTKNLQLFADLQYRNVQYEINGFRKNPGIVQNLEWNFFNPKVEIQFIPSAKTSLTLFVARSSKEPNRDDFEASPTALPVPEKLTDYELNWKQKIAKGLNFHTTLYYMDYQDQLVLTGKINDVGSYARTNIASSYRAGVEFLANYQLGKKLFLQGNISVSENKIENFTEYVDDYDNGGQLINNYNGTDISFSPSVIAGGQLTIYPWRGQKGNVASEASIDILPKYVGRQYLDNTQNVRRSIDPFTTTDVLINVPLKMKQGGTLKLRGGIMNVFNELYESNGYTFSYLSEGSQLTYNYYYPQAGIRWTLGVGVEF